MYTSLHLLVLRACFFPGQTSQVKTKILYGIFISFSCAEYFLAHHLKSLVVALVDRSGLMYLLQPSDLGMYLVHGIFGVTAFLESGAVFVLIEVIGKAFKRRVL